MSNENKPNGYRVLYNKVEGDNYAGGYVERTANIKYKSQLIRYDYIIAVYPTYTEVFDPLSQHDLGTLIAEAKIEKQDQDKADKIAKAEADVVKAQRALEELK